MSLKVKVEMFFRGVNSRGKNKQNWINWKMVAIALVLQYPLVDTKKHVLYTKNNPSLFPRQLESEGALVIN